MSTDHISAAASEWFDERCPPWRRAQILEHLKDKPQWVRWIKKYGAVSPISFRKFSDTLPRDPRSSHLLLFRGCAAGNERGASWTSEVVVASAYAKVRSGRVIVARAPLEQVMGIIVSNFYAAAPITSEVLLRETPAWHEL